jgi:NAD(P)-dependent dehydrogenase (short-subunit alcohol dehydrogenase family)
MSSDKAILITSAASSISQAAARRLGEKYRLILVDSDICAASKLADDLNKSGATALALEANLTNCASVHAMAAKAIEHFGAIYGAFNHVEACTMQGLDEITEDVWDYILRQNLKATLLVNQAILPHMLSAGSGIIVNSASDLSIDAVAGYAAYCAAKAAIYSMTKAMAVEFTSKGVRIKAIGIGPVLAGNSELRAEMSLNASMRRLGRLEEIASVVEFLMDDRSSYVAGQIIQANGGAVMW